MNQSKAVFAFAVILVLVTVVMVRAGSAPVDPIPATPQRTISATGSGSIISRPDSVRIYVGVVTRAKTVPPAREENSRTIAKVQQAIQALKLTDLAAKTWTNKVEIVTDYHQEFIDYKISQYFSIVFHSTNADELATAAGRILDAALQNGANELGQVEFFLADETDLERKAKTKAVENALANAAALAVGAKLKIVDVIGIQDKDALEYGDFVQRSGQGQFGGGGADSEIFPGEVRVSASVRIVCRY